MFLKGTIAQIFTNIHCVSMFLKEAKSFFSPPRIQGNIQCISMFLKGTKAWIFVNIQCVSMFVKEAKYFFFLLPGFKEFSTLSSARPRCSANTRKPVVCSAAPTSSSRGRTTKRSVAPKTTTRPRHTWSASSIKPTMDRGSKNQMKKSCLLTSLPFRLTLSILEIRFNFRLQIFFIFYFFLTEVH